MGLSQEGRGAAVTGRRERCNRAFLVCHGIKQPLYFFRFGVGKVTEDHQQGVFWLQAQFFGGAVDGALETRIGAPLSPVQMQRAVAVRALWREQRLSKLNPPRESKPPAGPFVLVVDQSAGDRSIDLGQASATSFRTMLAAAVEENPDCTVVVKVHPDVIHGRAQGHFRRRDLEHPRVKLCADGGHPAALLEQAM